MSDLHDEIKIWRLHLADESRSTKTVRSPTTKEMPYLGEFIGE